MSLLTLKNITKYYYTLYKRENLLILEDINWELKENSFTAITGKSGSGKSTLFNLISTLDSPNQGEILFDSLNILKAKEEEISQYRNESIGLIFQQYNLLMDFTALENVLMPSLILGEKNEKRAKELLEEMGLKERIHHYPYQLSGGEQQRVCIARSLINRPKLILADEPTGNLDEENSYHVQKMLSSLPLLHKVTLLAVTHDLKWANQAEEHWQLENKKLVKI